MQINSSSSPRSSYSSAATAANGGRLTAAADLVDVEYRTPKYFFDGSVYDKRVYDGWGKPEPDTGLKFGPTSRTGPRCLS